MIYTEEQTKKADQIRRGIKAAVSNPAFGWSQGFRNTMAVDLSCALFVLGYKDMTSKRAWVNNNLELDIDDHCDWRERAEVIEEYLDQWDNEPNGVFDKMLDPDEWIEWSENTE